MTGSVDQKLKISEIFYSIQGEALYCGYPCIFIRTFGCNLNCIWCDTKYSLSGSFNTLSINEIINQIQTRYPQCKLVELTGGEPLVQPMSIQLIEDLSKLGYKVLLETNGSCSIKEVPKDTHIIMDIKCPGSGNGSSNSFLESNLNYLKPDDEIKFVIKNRADFDWAKSCVKKYNLSSLRSNSYDSNLLVSAVLNDLSLEELSNWIKEEPDIHFKLNVQIHKFIWDQDAKGV